MKIALLTDGIYPDYVGGMQKHSTYLAKYLVRQGVQLDLYLRDVDEASPNLSLFSEDELRRIKLFRIKFPEAHYFPGHYIRQSYRYSSDLFDQLKKKLDIDFIYAQGFSGWRLIKEKQKGLYCPPVGVNFHGYEMYQMAPSFKAWMQQLLFRPFVAANLKGSTAIFSYGGRMDDIIALAGGEQRRICHAPNAVDDSWIVPGVSSTTGPRRFLFVGRYERRKGIEELTKVLEKLGPDAPYHFDLVGPIPEKHRLRFPNLTYWGEVREVTRMQDLLRHCDILVCPSLSEGMPTIILEAMASGLAVVGTDVGAVPAMLDDEGGWLIPPGDVEALEKVLRQAITLPHNQLMAKKRACLRRVRESFLWDRVATTTLTQIQRVIERHAH